MQVCYLLKIYKIKNKLHFKIYIIMVKHMHEVHIILCKILSLLFLIHII